MSRPRFAFWLLCLGLALGGWAMAEQRFPPPDFQEGHIVPETHHPTPRALWRYYGDTAVLVASLGLAAWLVLKQRSRRGVVVLSLFSLLYFGFYRKGCTCAIGSVQNVALALFNPDYAVPLTVLVFFVAPLLLALFFGRVFCAAVCPHGALQDLVLVKPVTVPRWLEQGLGLVPYLYLGVGVLFAATGSTFLICRYDPFVPIFRMTGPLTMVLTGAVFVGAAMFIGRPYCRFLCPYGALLRLVSSVSKWAPRITPDQCTQCRLCETACPFGAINSPSAPAPAPKTIRTERGRFLGLLAALPVLVLAGAWLGSRFAEPASRLNPRVALADFHLQQQSPDARTNLTTVEELAQSRAQKESAELLPEAVAVRRRFTLAGALFGVWIALVVGVKQLGFSFWRKQTDYEPDRAGCLACARCFLSCPQERVRLGLMPAEEAAALGARATA
jgi:NosR/NirI family nitrous oxide reductase transcriptional regulator